MPSLALLTAQALQGDLAATRLLLATLGQMLVELGNGSVAGGPAEAGRDGEEAGQAGRMLVAACGGEPRAAWMGGWRYGRGIAQAWSMDGVGGMLLRGFDGAFSARVPTQVLWTPGDAAQPEAIGAALAGEWLDCALAHDDLDFLVPPGSLAALYVTDQGKAFIDHDPGVLGLARTGGGQDAIPKDGPGQDGARKGTLPP